MAPRKRVARLQSLSWIICCFWRTNLGRASFHSVINCWTSSLGSLAAGACLAAQPTNAPAHPRTNTTAVILFTRFPFVLPARGRGGGRRSLLGNDTQGHDDCG